MDEKAWYETAKDKECLDLLLAILQNYGSLFQSVFWTDEFGLWPRGIFIGDCDVRIGRECSCHITTSNA